VNALILIVEDNEMNLNLATRRLARMGFRVCSAGDGQEGVEVARRERPDIILMDMSLPVLDGWTATAQLKSRADTRHIPVVALTAHAMAGDRERALAAGCDEYESKPVNFAELGRKLSRLLALHAPPVAVSA